MLSHMRGRSVPSVPSNMLLQSSCAAVAIRSQSVMHGTHFASKHSIADLKISSFIWMDMLMKFVSSNLEQHSLAVRPDVYHIHSCTSPLH